MASDPEESSCWLARDPASGLEIRAAVRTSAVAIWRWDKMRTELFLGDSADLAPLMETSAVATSAYLDSLGPGAASANVRAVLRKVFCRALARHAGRLRRFEPASPEIESQILEPSWEDSFIRELLFEKLASYLSADAVTILSNRRHGYEWDDIAAMLGMPVAIVRSRFWREIKNAKAKLGVEIKKRRRRRQKPA